MKKILPLVAILSLPAITAFADLLIVQEIEQTGGPQPMKMEIPMKIKGEQLRIDMGKQGSSIVNLQSGETTVIMHPQKTYMVIPKAAMDAQIKQMEAANAASGASKKLDAPKPTGEKQKINGHDTEAYLLKSEDGDEIKLWLVKDFPNQDAIKKQFEKLNSMGPQTGASRIDYKSLPGFPVRIEVSSPEMGKSVITYTSVKEVDIPASDFQTPSDYKKSDMPGMGN